jgi:hypothetical protein
VSGQAQFIVPVRLSFPSPWIPYSDCLNTPTHLPGCASPPQCSDALYPVSPPESAVLPGTGAPQLRTAAAADTAPPRCSALPPRVSRALRTPPWPPVSPEPVLSLTRPPGSTDAMLNNKGNAQSRYRKRRTQQEPIATLSETLPFKWALPLHHPPLCDRASVRGAALPAGRGSCTWRRQRTALCQRACAPGP